MLDVFQWRQRRRQGQRRKQWMIWPEDRDTPTPQANLYTQHTPSRSPGSSCPFNPKLRDSQVILGLEAGWEPQRGWGVQHKTGQGHSTCAFCRSQVSLRLLAEGSWVSWHGTCSFPNRLKQSLLTIQLCWGLQDHSGHVKRSFPTWGQFVKVHASHDDTSGMGGRGFPHDTLQIDACWQCQSLNKSLDNLGEKSVPRCLR